MARERIRGELQRVPALFAGWRDSQMSARRGQVRAVAEQPGTKALLAERGGGRWRRRRTRPWSSRARWARAPCSCSTRTARLIARTDRPREEGGRDFSGVSLGVPAPLAAHRGLRLHRGGQPRPGAVAGRLRARAAGRGDGARPQRRAGRRLPHGRRARARAGAPGRRRGRLPRQRGPAGRGAAAGGGGRDGGLSRSRPRRAPSPRRAAPRRPSSPAATCPAPSSSPRGGRDYLATLVPILSGSGEPVGGVVVARAKDEELAALREIRRSLLGVGAMILLLSVPLSFVFARALARPIQQLAVGRGGDRPRQPRRRPAAGGPGRGRRAGPRLRGDAARAEGEGAARAARGGPARARRGSRPCAACRPRAPTGLPARGPVLGHLFAQRYEIRGLVGRGGMGAVYRALDRELDEEVALKVLEHAGEGDAAASSSSAARSSSRARSPIPTSSAPTTSARRRACASSPWSTWPGPPCASSSTKRAGSPSLPPSRSPSRSAAAWAPCTAPASSTATSSPPTSW